MHDVVDSVARTPLPVLSLIVYMGIRSRTIMPPDEALELTAPALWAPAYFGWYDVAFIGSMLLAVVLKSVRITIGTLAPLFALLMLVLVSLLAGHRFGPAFITAGLVQYARFAAAFTLAAWLVERAGIERAEHVVFALFIVLAATALLVYSINLGSFNRIYASAMTVASFGQVAAVTCFIALLRRRRLWILLTAVFLLLTFSRTSILALGLLVAVYLVHFRGHGFRTRALQFAQVALLLLVGGLALLTYGGPEFEGVITRAFNREEVATLNGRIQIWERAFELVSDLRIPIAGVGFNAAPSLLATNEFLLTSDDGQTTHAAHFHSIVFEYGFGFGVFSLLIFFCLARRLAQTFTHGVYPAFFIFAFFMLTQSIDFTFYRPKEIVFWSFLLGIADAQWRTRNMPRSTTLRVRASDTGRHGRSSSNERRHPTLLRRRCVVAFSTQKRERDRFAAARSAF